MPDPTDFVTDLPADFEIFGDAVDATVDRLDVITTEGDLIVGDASGDPVRVAVGTAGQVLASDGDTVEWVSPAASGGMTLIATATPSAASSVSFTSIPTTFKKLIMTADSVFQSAGGGSWGVRLNNDSTTSYFEKMTHQTGTTINSSVGASAYFGATSDTGRFIPADGPTNDTNLQNNINAVFEIYGADLAAERKVVSWISSKGATQGGSIRSLGTYTGAAAISQIDLIRSSTQTITGTIRLYGIS
jgi:hypothetical protein